MFENIMSEERHVLLEELTRKSVLTDFYLAGGTAAALYLGHSVLSLSIGREVRDIPECPTCVS